MSVLYIVRGGILLAVPQDYAEMEGHRALVARLSATNSYLEAVAVLESAPLSWLAADVLTGATWARRYLLTTAKLLTQDKKLADRGTRALMRVLAGQPARVGRHRDGPLSPEAAAKAAAAVADWRALVDAEWPKERAGLALRLTQLAVARFVLSQAHRRALRALVRRQRLRKADVVLTLAAWEVGLPILRLRTAQAVADLVYG